MSQAVTYRSLTEEDFHGVFAAASTAWKHTYAEIFDESFIENFVSSNYDSVSLSRLLPGIESGSQSFDVARDGEKVVGFCHVGVRDKAPQLFRIYLDPEYVGRGIGSTLLDRGEEYLRAAQFRRYHCFVHQDNELGKRFYARRGFLHNVDKDEDDHWYLEKSL